jgi:hypothetical protein
MKTLVVNLYKEPFDVYIGRAGRGHEGYFGNPFRLKSEAERADAIGKYRRYFLERIERDPEFKGRILDLRGKRLGCFCKPKLCHGDVIAEWLDRKEPATSG